MDFLQWFLPDPPSLFDRFLPVPIFAENLCLVTRVFGLSSLFFFSTDFITPLLAYRAPKSVKAHALFWFFLPIRQILSNYLGASSRFDFIFCFYQFPIFKWELRRYVAYVPSQFLSPNSDQPYLMPLSPAHPASLVKFFLHQTFLNFLPTLLIVLHLQGSSLSFSFVPC